MKSPLMDAIRAMTPGEVLVISGSNGCGGRWNAVIRKVTGRGQAETEESNLQGSAAAHARSDTKEQSNEQPTA